MEGSRNPISQARALSFCTQIVAVADLQSFFGFGHTPPATASPASQIYGVSYIVQKFPQLYVSHTFLGTSCAERKPLLFPLERPTVSTSLSLSVCVRCSTTRRCTVSLPLESGLRFVICVDQLDMF